MWEDPLFWICVLPGLLLGAYAQSRTPFKITGTGVSSRFDGEGALRNQAS
jgi:hypothetical protein